MELLQGLGTLDKRQFEGKDADQEMVTWFEMAVVETDRLESCVYLWESK